MASRVKSAKIPKVDPRQQAREILAQEIADRAMAMEQSRSIDFNDYFDYLANRILMRNERAVKRRRYRSRSRRPVILISPYLQPPRHKSVAFFLAQMQPDRRLERPTSSYQTLHEILARNPQTSSSTFPEVPQFSVSNGNRVEKRNSGANLAECEVEMKFFGSQTNDEFTSRKGTEIMVTQVQTQATGVVVYKGFLKPNETFVFMSKRRPSAQFEITLYVNGIVDSRVTTCCEHKKANGQRLESKRGLFAIEQVHRSKPCRLCQSNVKHHRRSRSPPLNSTEEHSASDRRRSISSRSKSTDVSYHHPRRERTPSEEDDQKMKTKKKTSPPKTIKNDAHSERTEKKRPSVSIHSTTTNEENHDHDGSLTSTSMPVKTLAKIPTAKEKKQSNVMTDVRKQKEKTSHKSAPPPALPKIEKSSSKASLSSDPHESSQETLSPQKTTQQRESTTKSTALVPVIPKTKEASDSDDDGDTSPVAGLEQLLQALSGNAGGQNELAQAFVQFLSQNTGEDHGSRKVATAEREIGNVENFVVIWLDVHAEKDETNRALLRRTINFVKPFSDVETCFTFIQTLTSEKVCLIVSDALGESFVPRVQDLPQLTLIYILCETDDQRDDWAENQPKIRLVSTDLTEIINQLGEHVAQLETQLLAYTINPAPPEKYNIEFAYAQLLRQFILDPDKITSAKAELLEFCQNQYIDNKTQLKLIEEFERTFDPSKSICWFTRTSCFISKMIARGLHSPEPDILYKLRFFIQQLHQQIQSEPNPPSNEIIFYRSHMMSKDELKLMEKNVGGLLCFSAFLLTTTDKDVITHQPNSDDENALVPVLFRIVVDVNSHFKGYANIDKLCYNNSLDDTVLFSINAVFRITSVKNSADDVCCIDLTVIAEDDEQLHQAIVPLDKRVIDGPPLVRLTDLMMETDERFRADQFADIILADESPGNEPALVQLSKIYHALGTKLYNGLKLDEAIDVLNKSLKIQLRFKSADHISLTPTYNNLGSIYLRQKKYDLAIEHHDKALKLQLKSNNPDPDSVAAYSDNIASVYVEQKKFREAIPHLKRAVKIREQMLGENHKDLATAHHRIGGLHWRLDEFKEALEYYKKTLDIQLATLPDDDKTIAATYFNTGTAYEGLGELEKALEFAKKSVEQILKTLPPTHSDAQENIAFVDKLEKKIWVKKQFAS